MALKKLTFEIVINAPVEKVWDTMLEKGTFEKWTTEFASGSRYEGSWNKGATIRFLSPSGDGMLAEIAENRMHQFISIRHLAMIEKGTTGPNPAEWAPAYENYTFEEKDGGTKITVHQDILPEYESMFKDMWPRALKKLKMLCE